MESRDDRTTIFFLVAVMACAIILVDDRWVRAGLGLLPALLLAQRALMGAGVGGAKDSQLGAADRREDHRAREHIETLLKHFRQFYTTCHLMAAGGLEPEEAKSRAAGIERELNTLLAEVTGVAQRIATSADG